MKDSSKALIVVDMQNDFVTGCLGTPEARAIVPAVVEKIRSFPGEVFYTQDTHDETYLSTQEGRRLPVPHCIADTEGWQLIPEVQALAAGQDSHIFCKPTFGCRELAALLAHCHITPLLTEITLIGVCTDICVISNAMLIKAALPETRIVVDASCCAGVTPASHATALAAMKACQIDVIHED